MCNNILRQRSGAKSMLLHHHDIQDLLQVCQCIHPKSSLTEVQGDKGELPQLLAKSAVAERVEIDENGGEARSCRINSLVFTPDSREVGPQ